MHTKRILYSNPDGTLAIVVPAPGAEMEEVLRAVPASAEWREVHMDDLPEDRTFRGAWKTDLTVCMEAARGIHRDRLRAERAPELAALDVAYVRALEGGKQSEVDAVVDRKRALRDAPANPAIDAAETPEELAAIGLPR